MYAKTFLPENELIMPVAPHQRVNGVASVSFKPSRGTTRLDKLYQHGSAKVRFPKTYGEFCESVLINTAGGLTGGDRLDWTLKLDEETKTVITTQACEKSYKSANGHAAVSTRISVAKGATCHWLPQETILYEGSSLSRTLDVQLASDAKLIALEAVMLGREAMGETINYCDFKDRWRIYREDKLIFADDVKLEENIADLDNAKALMVGQKAFATLLYCSAEDDDQLEFMAQKTRLLMKNKNMAVSVFNQKLVARFLAKDTYELRASLLPVLKLLTGNELPKVWRI